MATQAKKMPAFCSVVKFFPSWFRKPTPLGLGTLSTISRWTRFGYRVA
ncbi:hypothetical protein [Streptomyces sp. SS]|nr:hypothetical protein [Streptomyces sp. SS]